MSSGEKWGVVARRTSYVSGLRGPVDQSRKMLLGIAGSKLMLTSGGILALQ